MNKVIFISFLLLTVGGILKTNTATAQNSEFNFQRNSFNGNFCVKFSENAYRNFYAVDMAQLNGEFGEKYFQDLVYKSNKVAPISTVNSDKILYLAAEKNFSVTEISNLVLVMKSKTLAASGIKTDTEKEQYNQNNSKIK